MCASTQGLRAPPDRRPGKDACSSLPPHAAPASPSLALLEAVEQDIIPRLVRLHESEAAVGAGSPGPDGGPVKPLDPAEIALFTEYLLRDDAAAVAFVRDQVDSGLSVPRLCLGLLAPAARLLGDYWDADRVDFAQVTLALGRLHALLRSVAGRLPPMPGTSAEGRRAVFIAAPEEQHTFGLAMVRDFFLAAGWNVWCEPIDGPAELLALVQSQRFDLVGVSIGSERNIERLASLIARLRQASQNRRLRVLAGGPLLLTHPECADRLGADATADDAREAILVADKMLATRDRRR